MPTEDLNKVVNITTQWKSNNGNVSLFCDLIRNWLKCISLTKYNPHVTWIRIQIENICNIEGYSYELMQNEIKEIITYFDKIIRDLQT